MVQSASEFLSTLNKIHPWINFTVELEDNGKRPLSWNGGDSNVKPNDTGLLLHCGDYQSHVDVKYEHSLLKAMLLTPGARFSKVPRTFRARKAIRNSTTCLFCKAGLFICCKGNKNKNNFEVSFLETPLFWGYKENCVTWNTPEKFRDFRETFQTLFELAVFPSWIWTWFLFDYTIRRFIGMKVTESACSQKRDVPVRIAPPDQRMR